MKYASTVWLEDDATGDPVDGKCATLVADTPEEAYAKGRAFLLKASEEFRDREEWPDDVEWIDQCYGESWREVTTPIVEN